MSPHSTVNTMIAEHGRAELADERSHHFTPRALMTMSMSLMPMNGTMMPPTP